MALISGGVVLIMARTILVTVDSLRKLRTDRPPRYSDRIDALWLMPAFFGVILPDARLLSDFPIVWLPVSIWVLSWLIAAQLCIDYRWNWSRGRVTKIQIGSLIILLVLALAAVRGYSRLSQRDESSNMLYYGRMR